MQLVGVDESSPALMSGGGLEVIGEQAVMVIAATPASALIAATGDRSLPDIFMASPYRWPGARSTAEPRKTGAQRPQPWFGTMACSSRLSSGAHCKAPAWVASNTTGQARPTA